MPDNPVQNTTFPSSGGQAHGYLATPPSGRGPGLIVIQEWWGLTTHIKSLADRFAAQGFVALAPDLYGGTTTHDAGEAQELMQQLPVDQASRELQGAVDFLLAHDAVTGDAIGAVGFCMGGGFVLTLAAQEGAKIAAAVPFYGVLQGSPDFSGMSAEVLGHYGTEDDMNPRGDVESMAARITEQSGRAPRIEFYEAGHAFVNDENLLGTYDAGAAKVAWDRTVEFLHATLG